MLTVKFEKINAAKYISHIDLLRHMSRILRRANVELSYSKGFNPHELMFFSSPIPVGLTSLCEYVTFATEEKAEGFIEKFNAASIDGIRAVRAWEVVKNPNFAATAKYADYEVSAECVDKSRLMQAFSGDSFEIVYAVKGEEKRAEVRRFMKSVSDEGDKVVLTLAFGNESLRIDRFLNCVSGFQSAGTVKTKMYAELLGELLDADEVLNRIKI